MAAKGPGAFMTAPEASSCSGGVAAHFSGATVASSDAQEEAADDPNQEAGCAGPAFVAALANVLTHLASLGTPGRPQRVTRFHAVRAPQLSVHEYLMRIAAYFRCSNECFVLGLVYIDRIVKLHPWFTICSLNIHRLLVTSIMLGAKFFDDVYYSNSYYAKVGGVRTHELNALEALFLRLIEWRLHVLPAEYEQYRNQVLTALRGSNPCAGLAPVAAATDGSDDAGGGGGHGANADEAASSEQPAGGAAGAQADSDQSRYGALRTDAVADHASPYAGRSLVESPYAMEPKG